MRASTKGCEKTNKRILVVGYFKNSTNTINKSNPNRPIHSRRTERALTQLEVGRILRGLDLSARAIGCEYLDRTGELPPEWIFELLDYCRLAEAEFSEVRMAS